MNRAPTRTISVVGARFITPVLMAMSEGSLRGDRRWGRTLAVELFVNGTLMRGLALHPNLAGAEFLGEFETAPCYRIYSIVDRHPGMFEIESGGISVPGEMYRLPDEVWARV